MSQRTLNSTGNKGRFLIVDNDGKPLTSVVYNTAGLALSVILQNGTEAAITLAVAGDLLNRGKGIYEVAVPNSAYTSLGDLTFCGVITDGAVVGFNQQVIAEVATASSVAAFFAKLFRWLGIIAGKESDPATLAEINATDGGATYNNVTDSLESLRDAIGPIKDDTTAIITGIETAKDEVIAELSPLATTDQLTTAKDEILTAMDTDQTELIEAFTEQLDATKDEILLAISDDNPVGPGGIPKEITITKLGVPVDGAAVWITLDIEGTNIIAGTLYTDTFGNVTFMLEAGTYYAWVQKAEVDFVNPTEITVE